MTPKILEEILQNKEKEVNERKTKIPLEDLIEIDYMKSFKRKFKQYYWFYLSIEKRASI